MIQTFPLESLSLEQAISLQFRAVDAISRHFNGYEILTRGDLGVHGGLNMPITTRKAEEAVAELFDAPDAVLIRGAGTGAIRFALASFLKPGDQLLIHSSPVYPTTRSTLELMGIEQIAADFNCLQEIQATIASHPKLRGALVQLTRQAIDDRYSYPEVIETIKASNPDLTVVTDDNYAAMKVPQIGVQCGADLSCFSCFKLQGPEGIGAVVGKEALVEKIHRCNYSGGSQVQGYEALDVLRGLVSAPVALAIQARVNMELVERLCAGELPQVCNAFLANAQSKVLLVEFREDIAQQLLEIVPKFGAAAHPVGAESKYELVPMIYRISATFRAQDSTLEKRMIRINPMRSGADTVIRILRQSLDQLEHKNPPV